MKLRSWVVALIFVCLLSLLAAPGTAESRITNVSAAASGCSIALNDNGTVWIWGSGSSDDDLGIQPVLMPGVDHVVAISGYLSPAVLKDDGTVWILRNYPYFENATRLEKWPDKAPVKVNGLSDIIAISGSSNGGSGNNLMALRSDGTVWMLGSNTYGQMGTSTGYGSYDYTSLDAVRVSGLSDIKAISMGEGHALALKADGTVWAWGMNDMGQLGDETISYDHAPGGKSTPVMVKGLMNVTAVAAGNEFSMALKDDGTVWAWGRNDFGMLGDGMPGYIEMRNATAGQVKGLSHVTSIAAGVWYALALRNDGTVWAWGDNRYYGMLGDGTTDNRNLPVQATGLSGIVSISAGSDHNLALDKYGVVWSWGLDTAGQLGDVYHDARHMYRATPDKVTFSEALAGPAVEPAWMVSPGLIVTVSPPMPEAEPIEYMAAVDDTIYAFSANGLLAMDSNGVPKWNLSIPGTWTYEKAYGITIWSTDNGNLGQMVKTVPIFAADDGYMYIYAIANASNSTYNPILQMSYLSEAKKLIGKELIAISPDGRIAWTRQFDDDVTVQDKSHVEARNGYVYLYHSYNETVFDASGNQLFTIENISDPVSVDEDRHIYAVQARMDDKPHLELLYSDHFDYRMPSNVIEKYSPVGKQEWRMEIDQNVSEPYYMPAVWNEKIGLPLYWNGTLYVPLDKGVLALNKDGDILWSKTFDQAYKVFNMMPMDSKGDLYMFSRNNDGSQDIVAVSPDGTVMSIASTGSEIASASGGILYENGKPIQNQPQVNVSPDDLEKATIVAYDMTGGKYVWNFTTPIGDKHTVIVNESNVRSLFPDDFDNGVLPGSIIQGHSRAEVIPAGNLTYIYFRTAAWDEPVAYDVSSYTYYSALYALDQNGKLVWQKPMDSFVTAMAANNSTIYYGTDNGKISVSVVEAAAGFVLIGSALALMFGYISRARSKIDKNENRNKIFRFIAGRPGSTLYEITRGTGMNMGTVRYHMMILGTNHRIVSFSDDGKFVRYFTNSNTYSKEDQLVISIMRRDSIGRILRLISRKAGNDEYGAMQ